MEVTPFRIQAFQFDAQGQVQTGAAGAQTGSIPGYFVVSTAPPNIEDAVEADAEEAERGLAAIAADLYRIHTANSGPPELVIAIHGYNTHEDGIKAWYSNIYRYVNREDAAIQARPNRVFIGYRWSSESLSLGPLHLWRNLYALPSVPRSLLLGGLGAVLLLLVALARSAGSRYSLLLAVLLAAATGLTAVGVTLLLLRVSVYFRDVYRATHFGVLDLVELIRQLDKRLVDLRVQAHPDSANPGAAQRSAKAYWNRTPNTVRLSFIGHSMGALVVTTVVRILSDVFDTRSVEKQPPSDIGNTLSLERLVLVAPDIPILSIISSRANVLASSLRRFNETYLFSNEGDLALRLASTTANYISFPSATRSRGYRLGNVALVPSRGYGIVNLTHLHRYFPRHLRLGQGLQRDPDDILDYLFVTYSGARTAYTALSSLFERGSHREEVSIADLFTFFDCTDYRDYCISFKPSCRSLHRQGILSRARRKQALTLGDYLMLAIDSVLGRRDGHGGYFHGEFSRQLIYRLAFVGFEDVLKQLGGSPQGGLEALHATSKQLGLQVYLSPLRYRVNVQGQPVQVAKAEMLQKIKHEQAAHQGSRTNCSAKETLP